MAWDTLKHSVSSVIKTNGNQEITGLNNQQVLLTIIDNLGENSTYKGVAIPSTVPGTPDGNLFYLALTQGTYSNFNGLSLSRGEVAYLVYNGSWSKIILKEKDKNLDLWVFIRQAYKILYPEYSAIDYVQTSDTPTSSVENNLYIPIALGTYTNFNNVVITNHYNQIIVHDGTQFVVKEMQQSSSYYDLDKLKPLSSGYYTKRVSSTYSAIPTIARKIGLKTKYKHARQQVEKLIINDVVTSNGNISIYLNGIEYVVALNTTMDIAGIVSAINAISYSNWAKVTGSDYVQFTNVDYKALSVPPYIIDSGNTGLDFTFRTIKKGENVEDIEELFVGITIDDWTKINKWVQINNSGYPIRLDNWVLVPNTGAFSALVGTYEYTSAIMKVEPGKSYSIENLNYGDLFNQQLAFYSDEPVLGTSNNYIGYKSVSVGKLFTPPENAKWVGVSIRRFAFDRVRVVSRNNQSELSDLKIRTIDKIGHLGNNDSNTDIKHIIIYGQSLTLGEETEQAITTTGIDGILMLGNSPDDVLSQKESLLINVSKEEPIVSAVHSFGELYRKNINKHQMFIGSSCGVGGKSITELVNTGASNDIFNTRFIGALKNARELARNKRMSLSCDAVVYFQGESDYPAYVNGVQGDKEAYKIYLTKLKTDINNAILSNYEQGKTPLLFIGQTSGVSVNQTNMGITMAQLEFAQENEDVILLNPIYQVPDYQGLHLSTNGARWFGEYIGKALFNTICSGEREHGIRVIQALRQSDNEIRLITNVKNENLPLVIDTWTTQDYSETASTEEVNGFRVLIDGSGSLINGVKVEGNSIILTTNTSMSGATTVIAMYASRGYLASDNKYKFWGGGNLRDSDRFKSLYTYWDDTLDDGSLGQGITYRPENAEGGDIIGDKYPMQNWLCGFYQDVEI